MVNRLARRAKKKDFREGKFFMKTPLIGMEQKKWRVIPPF